MNFNSKYLMLLLGAAIAWGGDKKPDEQFKAGSVTDYSARQTISKVTIAAQAFETDEQTRPPFGKNNPNKFGVLPILVVMKNDSDKALNLESIKVQYVTGSRQTLDTTPPSEVPYILGPHKPELIPSPVPGVSSRMSRKKNPLNTWQIEGRAFAARMLPPGESASGFFYYQTIHRTNAILLINGIREAATNKELFYFEIPFSGSETH